MTSTIAASVGEIEKLELIKQHLKNCLYNSKQVEQAELVEFYIKLAEFEEKSLEEVVEKISELSKEATKLKKLIAEAKRLINPIEQARILIAVYNLVLEIVEKYWNYLPPKAIEYLKETQQELEKNDYKVNRCSIISKIKLILHKAVNGEDLFTAYRKSALRLANAISEAVQRDLENNIDVEVARAAKAEAETRGTIPWREIKDRIRRDRERSKNL